MLIWLGLVVGSAVANTFSDKLKSRKKPILISAITFTIFFAVFLYFPLTSGLAGVLMFVLGFLNRGHMLSFTMAVT
jgi:sugar phosphate permease